MKKKISLVTGCAGFIGSNLVDELLKKNHIVYGIDNLRTGHLKNLSQAIKNKNFYFKKIDLLNLHNTVYFENINDGWMFLIFLVVQDLGVGVDVDCRRNHCS